MGAVAGESVVSKRFNGPAIAAAFLTFELMHFGDGAGVVNELGTLTDFGIDVFSNERAPTIH